MFSNGHRVKCEFSTVFSTLMSDELVNCSALRIQDVDKVRVNHPDKIPVSSVFVAPCYPFRTVFWRAAQ